MEITRAVRDYAAKLAEAERHKGVDEMSAKFRALGGVLWRRSRQGRLTQSGNLADLLSFDLTERIALILFGDRMKH